MSGNILKSFGNRHGNTTDAAMLRKFVDSDSVTVGIVKSHRDLCFFFIAILFPSSSSTGSSRFIAAIIS